MFRRHVGIVAGCDNVAGIPPHVIEPFLKWRFGVVDVDDAQSFPAIGHVSTVADRYNRRCIPWRILLPNGCWSARGRHIQELKATEPRGDVSGIALDG